MTKLLAFGDLHLRVDRLDDQRSVLEQIADLAIDEGVAGILCAGDVLDGPTIVPEQIDVFARFIARLQGRIPVVAVSGNGRHDLAMRGVNGVEIFNHLDGITVASRPDVVECGGCAVACLPWVHPGRLIASMGRDVSRDEINTVAAELLVDVARDLHDRCRTEHKGAPAILLAHWSISGASLPTGLPVDQMREPVLSIDDLDAIGFDHLVFGHIHRAQQVGARGFYIGTPLALDFGDSVPGHGVVIIHTDERDVVDFYAAEYRELHSPRFVTIDFDCTDELQARWLECAIEHPSMIDPALVDDAIVRFRYRASAEQQRHINTAALRQAITEAGARSVKIIPDIVREDRARVEGVDESLDELQALDLYLEANSVDEQLADRMRDRLRSYIEAAA